MKALGFIFLWLAASGVIFAFAFRGKRDPLAPKAKKVLGRMPGSVRALVAVAAIGAVIATPILVTASANDRLPSGAGTYTTNSSAHIREGRQIFRGACASCHTLSAANARGVYGPNLDTQLAGGSTPSATALRVAAAIKNGGATGKQMPVGLLDGADAKTVSDYVAAVAGK